MQYQHRSIATPTRSYFCRIPWPRVDARVTPSHDAAEAIPQQDSIHRIQNRLYDPNRPRNVFGFSESPPATHVGLNDSALTKTITIADPVALVDSARAPVQTSLKDQNRSLRTHYYRGIELMRETIAAKLGSTSANQLKIHEILRIASSPLFQLIKYPMTWTKIHNAPILGTAILQDGRDIISTRYKQLTKKTHSPSHP